MTSAAFEPRNHADHTIACICPMGVELAPVQAMLDEVHPNLPTQRDHNSYVLGEMKGHNIVIAVLPETGTNSAASVATQLLNDFSEIRFGLLVGIGGGVPDEEENDPDIRLGDVVYDLGKEVTGIGFQRTGTLNKPPMILMSSVEQLRADHRVNGSQVPSLLDDMLHKHPAMRDEYPHPGMGSDILFSKDYTHERGKTCLKCDKDFAIERNERRNNNPKFHYGTIGSANKVIKDALLREKLRQDMNLLCVEMEAAGLMDAFPCLVIRGICDYADSHKNKKWQPYAAATAAAYMKELLSVIPPLEVNKTSRAKDLAGLEDRLLSQMKTETDRTVKLISEELDSLVDRESLEMQRYQLLNSSKYPAMNERDNDISDAHEHTYHWVFDLSDFPSKQCTD